MAKAQENPSEAHTFGDCITAVEAARRRGLSISAACKEAGVSPSTYYRRRRRVGPLASLVGATAEETVADAEGIAPETGWPYTAETPRAPFFWDRVFADELSDSFVRRTFGAAQSSRTERCALSVLTETPPSRTVALGVLRQQLRPLGFIGRQLLPLVALVSLTALGGWVVSHAAEPAAWLRPADLIANTSVQTP